MKATLLALVALLSSGVALAGAKTQVTHPEWSRDAVIYEVNTRQFTEPGTFQAFEEHLPRLKDLGVDILWFMPINPISELNRKGELGSYYASADYKGVNPEFGTMDDFKRVVSKAHDLGMKVILDWVPNHTGCDNVWLKDHKDYYELDSLGNPQNLYDWTDVYVLNYDNPEMRKAMIDAMSYWLREGDVDGFRCDVAMEVPTDFWNEARPQLEAVKPGIFMLAEASVPELEEQAFDMAYNWPMKDLFSKIANQAGQYRVPGREVGKATALAIDTLLASQALEYPEDSYMMNMITNHDLNSWEGTEMERLGGLADAFAVLSYTLPGMPLIYTGQETGMNRAFEFFKKDTPPQWEPKNRYYEFYKQLNALKHAEKALRAGTEGGEMVRYATSAPDIFAFSREKDGSLVTVIANLGAEEQPVKFTGTKPNLGKKSIDYFSGKKAQLPKKLASGEYRVYVNR